MTIKINYHHHFIDLDLQVKPEKVETIKKLTSLDNATEIIELFKNFDSKERICLHAQV